MKLNLSETIEFFVVNSESQSYCWVYYKDEIIEKHLNEIDLIDKQSILSDTIAFAKAGLVSYTTVVNQLLNLRNETDLLVSRVMFSSFNLLTSYFHSLKSHLFSLGIQLFKPNLKFIILTEQEWESSSVGKLRLNLLDLLGVYCEDKETVDFGIDLFRKFQSVNKVPEGIDSNLLSFIFRIGWLFTEDGLDYVNDLSKHSFTASIKLPSLIVIGFVIHVKFKILFIFMVDCLKDLILIRFFGLILKIILIIWWNVLEKFHKELIELLVMFLVFWIQQKKLKILRNSFKHIIVRLKNELFNNHLKH
jgi:hypothetical protein